MGYIYRKLCKSLLGNGYSREGGNPLFLNRWYDWRWNPTFVGVTTSFCIAWKALTLTLSPREREYLACATARAKQRNPLSLGERVRVRAAVGRVATLMLTTFLYLTSAAFSSACDLKNLSFGASIEDTAQKYGLDTLGANALGESEIVVRGTHLCDAMPKDTMAVFTFLYGEFVRVKLERLESKGVLLAFAKENFAVPEGKGEEEKSTRFFDPESSSQEVIYKSVPYRETKEEEMIIITSKRHDALFKRIAREENPGNSNNE